jgi:L-lactate dehydrogenase complex protein LldE
VSRPRVGLFPTCLVDALRPEIGLACADLLEAAGCIVEIPDDATCCGQPASSSGATVEARRVAGHTLAALADYDYVVAPSGSCAAELRTGWATLFAREPRLRDAHARLAGKTFEILSFLHDVRRMPAPRVAYRGRVTYQDTCAGLRRLGVARQARALFANAPGVEWVEMADSEACCGFGGTFALKYAAISEHIADAKLRALAASGADTLLVPDTGCLLHLAGRLHRLESAVRCFHPVELLANRTGAAVCEGAGA